jgi:plasmid stabilization system protein ParE
MTRKLRVRWSLRARKDLLEIGRYIAMDDPQAARRWVERLRSTVFEGHHEFPPDVSCDGTDE